MGDELVQRLIADVRREAMTPQEADAIGAAAGLDPFYRIAEDPLSMTDSHWPLAVTILWVSWRDFTKVAEHWRRLQYWGRYIWNDQQNENQRKSLKDAENEVWQSLRSGFHLTSFGRLYFISEGASAAAGQHTQVSNTDWLNLEWMFDQANYWNVRTSHNSEPRYLDVMLPSEQITTLWPGVESGSTQLIHKISRKRGPKPTKGDAVKARMRRLDPAILSGMKLEEMESMFGVSKTHCVKLRQEVLEKR